MMEARRRQPAGFFVAIGKLLLKRRPKGAMRRVRLTPAAFAKEAA
jgi:hypothetical protein